MLFSILIIILLLVIGFFHYLQGFFSATISAILAVISAAVAVGFYEPLTNLIGPTKFADQAHALLLVSLFAVTYTILRVLFDKLVPGNVRVQSTIDKVGGALMGLVAGTFATGIVAIAAQTLPFGPAVGGYARLPLKDAKDVQVKPTNDATALDRKIIDEVDMKGGDFATEPQTKMLVPVDDLVEATISTLSEGSLAGSQPLRAIHPDLLRELFGQRLGIETGTRHAAYNYDGKDPMAEVISVYRLDRLPVAKDAELPEIRGEKAPQDLDKLSPEERAKALKSQADKLMPRKPDLTTNFLLAVRCKFKSDARDKDDLLRVSTGSVRLVAGGRDFYPLGTIQTQYAGAVATPTLFVNHIDDPLIVDLKDGDRAVDFAFVVPRKDVLKEPDKKEAPGKPLAIAPGVLFEAKRLALTDLSDKPGEIDPAPPDEKHSQDVAMVRKIRIVGPPPPPKVATPVTPVAPPPPTVQKVPAPLVKTAEKFDNKLFTPVDAGTDQDGSVLNALGVTGELKGKKYVVLDVGPDETIDKLKFGKDKFDELVVPPGKNLYQVQCTPSGDSWAWGEKANSFEVADDKGAVYKLVGYWVVLKPATGAGDHMLAHYDPNTGVGSVAKVEGTPTTVWLAYLLPAGAVPKELRYEGKLTDTLTATPPR